MLIDKFSELLDLKQQYFFTFTTHHQKDLKVVDFTLQEEISLPFMAKITVASTRYDLDPQDYLDAEGLLTFYRKGTIEKQVHGVVTAVARGDRKNKYYLYTLTFEPKIFRLDLRHNVRIFQQQTVEKIVTTLLREAGVFFYNWNLKAKYEPREFCVQYRETDLTFVKRLLAEEGINFYFQHLHDRHIICFYDHYSGIGNLDREIPYHLPQGGVPASESIYTLFFQTKTGYSDSKLNDYCFKKSSFALSKNAEGDLLYQNRLYYYYDYPGRYKNSAEGERYARKRLAELRKELRTATIKSDVLALEAGYRFHLTSHIDDSLNQNWLVTRITHTGTQHQVLEEEGIVGETLYHNEALLIDSKIEWVGESTPKPLVDGPQVAVVTGPKNEEIYCDEFARVRVKFPWDIYRTPEPYDESGLSCWIRVSQNWAGAAYGAMQLPRVGQEVIVTFLNGDPDQPIITGRVYNDVQTTPLEMPAYKAVTTIKSKEHRGGGYNALVLDDTQAKIKAKLQSSHGTSELSLGYLKAEYQRGRQPDHRGDGFELRTDEWGAIRAGKGLYISTDIREKAEKKQLDLEESIVQLEQALMLAKELARAADTAQTKRTDVKDQEAQYQDTYKELKAPGMLLSSPEGIALTSPKSIQTSSSKNLTMTSYQSTDMSSFKDFRVVTKNHLSLLAIEQDLHLTANQGKMKIQAQNNELELSSKQELRITSNEDRVVIMADKEILLASGDAYIRIKDGKVEVGGPQPLDIKTAGFNVVGSSTLGVETDGAPVAMPKLYKERFQLLLPSGKPMSMFDYKISGDEGEFIARADKDGYTREVFTEVEESLKVQLTSFELEEIDDNNEEEEKQNE